MRQSFERGVRQAHRAEAPHPSPQPSGSAPIGCKPPTTAAGWPLASAAPLGLLSPGPACGVRGAPALASSSAPGSSTAPARCMSVRAASAASRSKPATAGMGRQSRAGIHARGESSAPGRGHRPQTEHLLQHWTGRAGSERIARPAVAAAAHHGAKHAGCTCVCEQHSGKPLCQAIHHCGAHTAFSRHAAHKQGVHAARPQPGSQACMQGRAAEGLHQGGRPAGAVTVAAAAAAAAADPACRKAAAAPSCASASALPTNSQPCLCCWLGPCRETR